MNEPEEYGVRKLEIYKLGHALGLRAHALTLTLPYFEHREEGSQLRRSSKSVTALMVEGYRQRKYRDEFLRYLHKASGSADESREHLTYLRETGSLKDVKEGRDLEAGYDRLCGAIEQFITGVSRDHSKPFYLRATNEPPPPPKSEIRNPKSHPAFPQSEVRPPQSEIGKPKSPPSFPESGVLHPQPPPASPQSEIPNPKSHIAFPQPGVLHPQPPPASPQSEIRNP